MRGRARRDVRELPITCQGADPFKLEQPRAMIDKAHILSEICRTATENGGGALGRQRFEKETGIRTAAWFGKYWSKWGDALAEAGFAPNDKQQPYDEDYLLSKLAAYVAELGRIPNWAERKMKAHADSDFPSHTVWSKLGPTIALPAKLLDYCSSRPEFHHLVEICRDAIRTPESTVGSSEAEIPSSVIGYVYLIKFRSEFKIGASADSERRFGEVATQMPETMTNIHTIKTDDPFGVEKYWHRRFEDKRLKGEWFKLTPADVRAFKRWKTIF